MQWRRRCVKIEVYFSEIYIWKFDRGREAEVAQNVKSSGDCTRMVRLRDFLRGAWAMCADCPEILICKLEPGWEAEVARSVKHHRDCTRMNPFEISGQAMRSFIIIMHWFRGRLRYRGCAECKKFLGLYAYGMSRELFAWSLRYVRRLPENFNL